MTSRDINEQQHALRFLDVDEEPEGMFPPIQDFETIPLVSFNEAVVPLQTIIPNIKHMVQTVIANRNEPEDGLTIDESNSIRLYSLEWQSREKSLCHILTKALRSENRQQLKPWLLFLRLILTALVHLPSTSQIVYRGINIDLTSKYRTGTTIVWWGLSSCMKKSNRLEKSLFLNKIGQRTLFVINCYSGKDIHRYSMYDGEVLLLPACQFDVVNSVHKEKGLHIIELKEVQPFYDFYKAVSSSTTFSSVVSPCHIQYEAISTVSLCKKTLPVALPKPRLEEHFAYLFRRHSKVDLKSMNLTDSDMDIVVSEIIIKRQCSEVILSRNKITSNGILVLSHALRKNKGREIIFLFNLQSEFVRKLFF
ncbi:unnamed protein product [Rotaria sp. Silwood1]|nr:unnamed protein product [Rotaria sp. Silwood1]CAF3737637.1 unnamed protein product [Rotaria sp. Silwood1]CAF3751650.1 unnamed protein product [Rotaria sp. Silwood1]